MNVKSGIYGLFRLDRGPLDPRDAAALGFAFPPGATACAYGVDTLRPAAVQRDDDGGALTLLVGDLEEPVALADRLGLAPDTPPATLARAALARFGDDLPAIMHGEWILLHWDAAAARLDLVTSAARRDRLLVAIAGPRVAVAADPYALSRLPWVGAAIDEAGLLFAIGRAGLRGAAGDRTLFAAIRQLVPATRMTIDADGCGIHSVEVLTPQPRWQGSFAEALAEADALMQRIMAARIGRHAKIALLLSGGLDSSMLCSFAARARDAGQPLLSLTSIAPPDSGIADEADFSDLVSDTLGLERHHVYPAFETNIYRPHDAILAGACGPPLSVRHCLTDRFQQVAHAQGATAMIDGTYGEMTMTGGVALLTARSRLRDAIGRARRRLSGRRAILPEYPFHARLAPHRLAALPDAVAAAMRAAAPPLPDTRRLGENWGYLPGADKALMQANEFYAGALRMEFPFRDVRLLRLFAGFPAAFLVQAGLDRAPARHLLAGRLPDAVRLRRSGMPASPDHLVRLRRQAPAARHRIAELRRMEVDDWVDLDWLDGALARVAAQGPQSHMEANEVQVTAIFAEFLAWWRARNMG